MPRHQGFYRFLGNFLRFLGKKEVYLRHKKCQGATFEQYFQNDGKNLFGYLSLYQRVSENSSRKSRLEVVLKMGWLKNAFWNSVFKRVPKGCPLKAFHDILWIATYGCLLSGSAGSPILIKHCNFCRLYKNVFSYTLLYTITFKPRNSSISGRFSFLARGLLYTDCSKTFKLKPQQRRSPHGGGDDSIKRQGGQADSYLNWMLRGDSPLSMTNRRDVTFTVQ